MHYGIIGYLVNLMSIFNALVRVESQSVIDWGIKKEKDVADVNCISRGV